MLKCCDTEITGLAGGTVEHTIRKGASRLKIRIKSMQHEFLTCTRSADQTSSAIHHHTMVNDNYQLD